MVQKSGVHQLSSVFPNWNLHLAIFPTRDWGQSPNHFLKDKLGVLYLIPMSSWSLRKDHRIKKRQRFGSKIPITFEGKSSGWN